MKNNHPRKYVAIWPNYRYYFEPLTREEIGNLVIAMMDYVDGFDPIIDERISFVWPAIKANIDETNQYEHRRWERNVVNGQKGGRPKNPKENPTEPSETHGLSENPEKGNINRNINININRNNRDNNNPFTPIEDERLSPEAQQAANDWLQYKRERNEKYKPIGQKSLITIIANKCTKYGDAAVIDVIQRSMASNYKGIVWDWLEDKGKQQALQKSSNQFLELLEEGVFDDE